jgi:hypothetical protein
MGGNAEAERWVRKTHCFCYLKIDLPFNCNSYQLFKVSSYDSGWEESEETKGSNRRTRAMTMSVTSVLENKDSYQVYHKPKN